MAEDRTLRLGDCAKGGGVDLSGPKYDAVMKSIMAEKSNNKGRMYSDGANTYVLYSFDGRGWLTWMAGIPIYTIGICAF